ncbi:MAG: hypothetical protein ACYDDC_06895, partial [Thermoplasmataceae archaeon]
CAQNNVSVISSSNNTVVKTVNVGAAPRGVAYDSGNGNIYVTNCGSNNVSVISSSSNTVVKSINVGTIPRGVAYDSGNGNIYVANLGTYNVSVISSSSNTVVKSINVGTNPNGIAYDSGNGNIYVTNTNQNNVTVISSSNTIVTSINVGVSPYGIAYDSGNGNIYVANCAQNNVSVISPSNTVVKSINVGRGPEGVAYDGGNGNIYVVNYASNNVSVISPSNNVVASVNVGTHPFEVAYDGGNGNIYVTNFGSSNVSVIIPQTLLEFTETGLPQGMQWNVTLGGQTYNSTTDSIAIAQPMGSFNYSLSSDSKKYSPDSGSGSVVVNTEYTHIGISFSPYTYMLEFTETGLPTGTPWTLTVNGTEKSSTSGIYFNLTNGTYAYTISGVPGYALSSYSSSVTIPTGNRVIPESWTKATSSVTFKQTGLPSGSWYVNITGQTPSGSISFSNPYSPSLPNGTYSYSISTTDKKYSAIGSNFTVDGTHTVISISFSPYTYMLEFTETGLPTGTPWTVTVNGTEKSSTSGIYFNLTNGTYAYIVHSSSSIYAPSIFASNTVINGKANITTLSFTKIHYTLSIHETGLSSGTSWSVTVDGNIHTSTKSYINLTETNGTYYISALSNGYTSSMTYNTTGISGSNETVTVHFSLSASLPSVSSVSSSLSLTYIIVAAIIASGAIGAAVIIRKKK